MVSRMSTLEPRTKMVLRRVGRVIALLFALCVCSFLLPDVANADQWSPSITVPPGSDGVSFVDNSQWNTISYIVAGAGLLNRSSIQCLTITLSGPCALSLPGTTGMVTALLPICESASSTDCVASMSLGASAQALVPSTFVAMTDGTSTPGDPTLGIPVGSTEELWTNPLSNLGGTTTYATLVATRFRLLDGKVMSATLSAAIYPYSEITENNFAPFVTTNPLGEVVVEGGGIDCAYTYATRCGRLEDFPAGTQASLSIRVTNLIGGWFRGRLQDPTISETPFDATSNTISVSAAVVTVPTLSFVAPVSKIQSIPSTGNVFTYLGLPPPPTAAAAYVLTDSPEAFTALNDIRGPVDNTASGQMTVWSFGTLSPWTTVIGARASCLNDSTQVDGIVTTNSMAYQPGPPIFSGEAFSYDVAGMHYNAGGSVALGTYDLTLRDSVADCLYGFTSAPISATVTVTEGSTGDQNAATTTVSDGSGWLHVGAYGFNFSDPTIKVKLTQISRHIKRVTITCLASKFIKRVIGVHPRCPLGFKNVVQL